MDVTTGDMPGSFYSLLLLRFFFVLVELILNLRMLFSPVRRQNLLRTRYSFRRLRKHRAPLTEPLPNDF